jgi:hypothetical protein
MDNYFKDRLRVRNPNEQLTVENCSVLRVDDDWLPSGKGNKNRQNNPKQLSSNDFGFYREFDYADISFYCECGIFCIIKSPFEDDQVTKKAIRLKFPEVFGENLMLDEF